MQYAFSQAGLDVGYVYSTAKEMQKLVTLKLIENKICFCLSFAVGYIYKYIYVKRSMGKWFSCHFFEGNSLPHMRKEKNTSRSELFPMAVYPGTLRESFSWHGLPLDQFLISIIFISIL